MVHAPNYSAFRETRGFETRTGNAGGEAIRY